MAPDLACGTIGVLTPSDRRSPEGATVSTPSILAWVACVTSNLRPSRSSTLAVLVAAAIRTARLNLATIGRRLAGPVTAQAAIARISSGAAPNRRLTWDRSGTWTARPRFAAITSRDGFPRSPHPKPTRSRAASPRPSGHGRGPASVRPSATARPKAASSDR